MKVALLFSGQPRYVYSSAYLTIKSQLLDKYDCDVFVHCWWDGDTTEKMVASPWSHTPQGFAPNGQELRHIQELYQPKRFITSPSLPRDSVPSYPRTHYPIVSYNLTSMYTSMKRVWEQCQDYEQQTNQTYDVYMRIRFDDILVRVPDLSTLPPSSIFFIDHTPDRPVLTNHFVMSTSREAMDRLMNVVSQLQWLADHTTIYINDEEIIGYVFLLASDKLPDVNVVKLPMAVCKCELPQEHKGWVPLLRD